MSETIAFLPGGSLDALLSQLTAAGYRVIGPQIVQGAVQYRPLAAAAQLPWGSSDVQRPGYYRVGEGDGTRAFAWANGPQALKPLFFAPEECLWQVKKTDGLAFNETLPSKSPTAIVGVRACDLAALAIHDQHFLGKGEPDLHYARRREETLLIAVNCTHPAATCFCAATGDGPNAKGGYDLLMEELDEGFCLRPGSDEGVKLLASMDLGAATAEQIETVEQQRAQVSQQHQLPGTNLQGKLVALAEHPHWQQIAERCLACGNCTAVCPTCFCHSEHDVPQLDGEQSKHVREWDSCFSADHSMLHGIPVRAEAAHRYRQWLTHKFDHWHQQYGRSGCVGCGRCITWCPVGIDVTQELSALCGEEA